LLGPEEQEKTSLSTQASQPGKGVLQWFDTASIGLEISTDTKEPEIGTIMMRGTKQGIQSMKGNEQ